VWGSGVRIPLAPLKNRISNYLPEFFVNNPVNIVRTVPAWRPSGCDTGKDGSAYTSVLFRAEGKQSSMSFDDHAKAVQFRDLGNRVGPAKAMDVLASATNAAAALTVEEWITHHLDHLTGVEAGTVQRYPAYLANDIAPMMGATPLVALGRDDIAAWVNAVVDDGASGKTIANKQRFLSGALNAAVAAGHLGANPCRGLRLPRWQRREMVFLTEAEFATLLNAVTGYRRPFVEFLVASGARWSEATALRPGDVDVDQVTVRSVRAWKVVDGGINLGPPKSKRGGSNRFSPRDGADRGGGGSQAGQLGDEDAV
jgi:hypothetical protein